MDKQKLTVFLILLIGVLNLYVSALDAKIHNDILSELQEQLEESASRHLMEDWIYDELDKSTWWMEDYSERVYFPSE